MTSPQARKLRGLCRDLGILFDDSLTKAEASQLISELSQEVALEGYVSDILDENWGEPLAQQAIDTLLERGLFVPTFADPNPDFWAYGGRPMTDRQRQVILDLSSELDVPAKLGLSRAEAFRHIGELMKLGDRRHPTDRSS